MNVNTTPAISPADEMNYLRFDMFPRLDEATTLRKGDRRGIRLLSSEYASLVPSPYTALAVTIAIDEQPRIGGKALGVFQGALLLLQYNGLDCYWDIATNARRTGFRLIGAVVEEMCFYDDAYPLSSQPRPAPELLQFPAAGSQVLHATYPKARRSFVQ